MSPSHDRYTTVRSTMDNLHRKGWLVRGASRQGPSLPAEDAREGHSAKLMHDAFESGGGTDLVSTFFLDQMNDRESAEVQAALCRIIDGRSNCSASQRVWCCTRRATALAWAAGVGADHHQRVQPATGCRDNTPQGYVRDVISTLAMMTTWLSCVL